MSDNPNAGQQPVEKADDFVSSDKAFNFSKALARLQGTLLVKSDARFNKETAKAKHESAYTTILDAYAENIEKTLKAKRLFKAMVFWLAFILLACVCQLESA